MAAAPRQSTLIQIHHKTKGRQIVLPPFGLEGDLLQAGHSGQVGRQLGDAGRAAPNPTRIDERRAGGKLASFLARYVLVLQHDNNLAVR